MLETTDPYEGREQTKVKHLILENYLDRFAHIIGSVWPSITYVDGFSGPWRNRNEDQSDTSFGIALKVLRRARETRRKNGKDLRIRCVFVEKDKKAFEALQGFIAENQQEDEIHAIHGEFEKAIPDIIQLIKQDADTFPFVLIDPTGFSGFAMKRIERLFSLQHGEVLINFMLEFIRRSIETKGLEDCYAELYGTTDFSEALRGLQGEDRDDAIVEKYCESLKRFWGFDYVLRASVLHPDKDRLNFLLVYGTRHIKGVEVFKKTEAKVMKLQETSRAKVEEKKKLSGGQTSFLEANDMPDSEYTVGFHSRYCEQARNRVAAMLNEHRCVEYDHLWIAALSFPMVNEADLRGWLKNWRDNGLVEWRGLSERGRELIHSKGHKVAIRDATMCVS